jgi:hypothetical protein
MNKGKPQVRRAFGRQLAAELPEHGLARIAAGVSIGGGGDDDPMNAFSTCDGGVVTHNPWAPKDCTGTADDVGGPLPI